MRGDSRYVFFYLCLMLQNTKMQMEVRKPAFCLFVFLVVVVVVLILFRWICSKISYFCCLLCLVGWLQIMFRFKGTQSVIPNYKPHCDCLPYDKQSSV